MPLCAFDRSNGKWCTIKDKHITNAVRFAVTGCSLMEKGYKLAKVALQEELPYKWKKELMHSTMLECKYEQQDRGASMAAGATPRP
eukprot:3538460-Ditylum_brightwellii.AAC.1